MPVDEYGERADLWIDMNSPVSRNNPGQLYETGVNRIGEFVRRKVEKIYEIKGVDAAHDTLLDWYGDINPNFEKLVREGDQTTKDRKKTVEDAIQFSPRVWIPPFLDTLTPDPKDFWNALRNIKKWATKWDVKPSRITYKSLQADGTGKEFTSISEFSIGSKYVLLLHKIPEIFAPGPASVNHIGIPTKSNFDTKHFPVTVNPYRYGEDELRIMAMDTPIREVTRFQNLLSNSPDGVRMTIQSILLSKNPTTIKRIPISNGRLFQTNAVLNLFHNVTGTLGINTKTTKDDDYTRRLTEIVDSSAELTDSIWNADIINANDQKIEMFSDSDDGVSKRVTTKRSKVQKMIDSMDPIEMEPEDTLDLEDDDVPIE